MKPVVAVDLDGTIAQYDGWKGEEEIGDPFPGAVAFLTALKAAGVDVVIFTARCGTDTGEKAVWKWLQKHGVANIVDEVTNVKQYRFSVIIDDRAEFAGRNPSLQYGVLLGQVKTRIAGVASGGDEGSPSGE